MEFKDRFSKLLDKQGVSVYRVSKDTGIVQPLLANYKNGTRTPKHEKIDILAKYFDVSSVWLQTGAGGIAGMAMKYEESDEEILDFLEKNPEIDSCINEDLASEPQTTYASKPRNTTKKELSVAEEKKARVNYSIIPILPISAQGGGLNDFIVSVKSQDLEYVVSPIKDVDFVMTVAGDSMSPEYPSGSYIYIKKINQHAFIEWGKVYVLDTCNGTIIKEIHVCSDEGYVMCHSVNPDPKFAPFKIKFEDINGMYKVLLCMATK